MTENAYVSIRVVAKTQLSEDLLNDFMYIESLNSLGERLFS